MAVADARRGSKRRRLSPPNEDQPQHSKRASRSQQNGTDAVSSPTISIPQTSQNVEMPSVKGLDSSEPAIRRSTLKTILESLQSRPSSAPFTHTQCLQLWRGLFITVYMHDSRSALSVQNLLREIAGIFSVMAAKDDEVESQKANSIESGSVINADTWLEPFHAAFWETVGREWAGIDSHRMNKYLLLVRFVLREVFTVCIKDVYELNNIKTKSSAKTKSKKTTIATEESKQNPPPPTRSINRTKSCINTLETIGPLNSSERRISDGLRLHILDIWTDELFGALSDLEVGHELGENDTKAINLRRSQLAPLLAVFRGSVEKITPGDSGAQKHVRVRAKDAVKDMDEQLEERSLSISA